MVPFAERLQTARLQRKLTQKDIAVQLGMTERSYQHYEGGTRRPNFETLAALADLLGVSTDYLLGLTDREEPYPRT